MKLSDYVFKFLDEKGIDTVFYLPGGGCMHLLDSLSKNKNINAISLLHEQAVAIACEGYANTKGSPGVALVTTGPGGTNTVTGVLAAYLDSTPCFFISGQVKTTDLKSNFGVRSHGSQEADIVSIIKPITKYAEMIIDPNTILYHLEKAWHEMVTGRKGPVWLDIPLDIQGAQIEPEKLIEYTPKFNKHKINVQLIIDALKEAKRPVIIAGNGLNSCKDKFNKLIDFLQIPIIPTWKAMDYLPNNHPLYCGRAGGMGDRPGNLAMQNSDLLLCLGSRLDFSITGFDRTKWAVNAKKVIVEIDKTEIKKLAGANNIIPVIADINDVLEDILNKKDEIVINPISEWKTKINEWKSKYPIKPTSNDKLTAYHFIGELCNQLPEGAHVAPCSSGTAIEIFCQAFIVKQNQVIRSNHGLGSMGFDIPNAIGMCIASGLKDVVCVAGDGGVQMNIQELAVVRGRNLPIKLFVLNNNGYASIRNMQNNHFNGNFIGCDKDSDLFLPDIKKIANSYEIPFFQTNSLEYLAKTVNNTLQTKGPVICEVIVDSECFLSLRTTTKVMPDGSMRSSPLENQFPFLAEDEIRRSMLI